LIIFLFGLYGFFLAVILSYNLLQLNLLFHYLGRKRVAPPPPLDEGQLPFVTVQLPLYNEAYVAERLLDNIARMRYPRDRFEVQVLDDSTDQTTELCEQRAVYHREHGLDIQVLHRTDRTGYKAGALAEGLLQARGEFVAIFDADFLPDPNFLRATVPYFQDRQVGVVQTRWTHLNDDYSLFTNLQALQLNVHFTIEQAGRKAGRHFLQFNGTAGIWRRQAIDEAGGWRSDTLTEDLDLSFRAQLRDWQIVYLEEVEAPAELPVEMNGIKSQQFRWMKGGAENARRLVPVILQSGLRPASKLHAVAHLLNSSIFLAVFLLSLTSVALLPFIGSAGIDQRWLSVSLLGLVGVATVYFYANIHLLPRPLEARRVLALIGYFPLLLTMSVGLSLHNSVAVLEGYLGIKSAFERTPKYNIVGSRRRDLDSGQRRKPISLGTIGEGLLALVFSASLLLAVSLHQYLFFVFHLMLAAGFTAVFVATLRDR
jgi:cellulose synthase/poly-beta-1,6-N-acetylglucosamine synthase-like glycosyltransferase